MDGFRLRSLVEGGTLSSNSTVAYGGASSYRVDGPDGDSYVRRPLAHPASARPPRLCHKGRGVLLSARSPGVLSRWPITTSNATK